MASAQAVATTVDSKSPFHSWIVNSHTSLQDKPEREIIAFSTGFVLKVDAHNLRFGIENQEFLKWLLPIIFISSLVSNLIMIRIMYSLSQWKFPPCLYMVILSSLDILNNMVKILDKWCQVTFFIKFLNSLVVTSHVVCSTFTITLYLIIHMMGLIRSALCIDLYYSYKNPLANTRKIVITRIHHLLLLFTTLLLIINSHFLWTYSIMEMTDKQPYVLPGNYCTYLVKWVNPTFRDIFWPLVDFAIGELCPILSIILCFICSLFIISRQYYSHMPNAISNKKLHLDRHLIDVNTFIEMRKVFMIYNVLTLLLILLPNSVSIIYKSTKYQFNHAMKDVTKYSVARSSNRSYATPTEISILDITVQTFLALFSVSTVVASYIMSPHGFRKEFNSLFLLSKKTSKINYQI